MVSTHLCSDQQNLATVLEIEIHNITFMLASESDYRRVIHSLLRVLTYPVYSSPTTN